MTDAAITDILKNKGIYVTTTRVIVYRILSEQKGSINAARIHQLSDVKLDRVSVYRALQAFVQKGIISLLPQSKGWPRYLLKSNSIGNEMVKTGHIEIYFTCNRCGTLSSHKAYTLSTHLIPANYIVNHCEVILDGICSNCQASAQ